MTPAPGPAASPPDPATVDIGTTPVLHVDADAFFASVEQLDDPRLEGVPVLVGGVGGRGVVASASREAKRLGARSAMPIGMARRLCGPHHVVLSPRFPRYAEVWRAMLAVFDRHATVVEQLSIDEAWLALPAGVHPARAARDLRHDVRRDVGITVSVGAATTMVCAKMLSTWTKATAGPGSQVWLGGREQERGWMADQPVRALPGVGPVTGEALAAIEVTTIGELRALDPRELERVVGTAAARSLTAFALNDDPRRPDPSGERKQISSERTLATDVEARDEIAALVDDIAASVADSVRRHGGGARTVTVKLRSGDFTDVTRSRTLASPTDERRVLQAAAAELVVHAHAALDNAPVRLVGVAASGLTPAAQPTLDLA